MKMLLTRIIKTNVYSMVIRTKNDELISSCHLNEDEYETILERATKNKWLRNSSSVFGQDRHQIEID